ncbi:hypothetical protein EDD96_1211 [Streptomyces sp. Ag109_G2-6]|nr:hypothetical protein EDD96_1211 [Streptomyces sp. Ag109_G2-6]
METPTALVIGQLTEYLRELTRRLDPGAGWYGEFLRRDPEGMRACLDGAALPPWDVMESLLLDLPGAPGATAREAAYAAGLRAAAVAAWDARPEGAGELRTLLAAAAEQRAAAEEALRTLTARLDATADPAQTQTLSRELAWTHDDAIRATSRQRDFQTRLSALPLPAVPRPRTPLPPVGGAGPAVLGTELRVGGAGPVALGTEPSAWGAGPAVLGTELSAWGAGPTPLGPEPPVRGAGPAVLGTEPSVLGAEPAPIGTESPALGAEPPAGAVPPGAARGAFVSELLTLRAQGRSGEAHALLCEAALWPAGELPGLAEELGHAGLAADWATLLWEAASLPPDRLAAAAGALGEGGREDDAARLLRQGVARPATEVAETALALGAAGRDRETRALLEAYVRLRTADETAALARHDPHWFTPRLLRAARALSAGRHRDLTHALRAAGLPVARA